MVEELLDNQFFLEPEKALELIKNFFKKELPSFELIKIYNNGGFYGFGAEYKLNNIEVMLGGERGGLDYKILINSKQYSLVNFDERMSNIYSGSKRNYLFVFRVLKRFLSEIPS
ncbi:MAG: hypothetical protein WBP45_06865 [Daejeonella sp.]